MEWKSALIGVAVFVGGMLTEWIKSYWQQTRDLEAVRRRREDERRAFQRTTMLELQERLHDYIKAATAGYRGSVVELRATGKWVNNWSPDLVERHRDMAGRTFLLVSRVSDQSIRKRAEVLRDLAASFPEVGSKEEADALYIKIVPTMHELNDRIGSILRDWDVD